ncbi:MAG: alpha/beta hydrolase [Lachnospiraceae bacterium]|nr:alpha/beta hydrolase [Lachnospiraceae bacterium]
MKENTIISNSGRVYYWISDNFDYDKSTLFFLHGLTGNHSMFYEQTKYFFDKYNLILWDAPAHGKSRPFTNFTYEKAANIIKQIFDKNNILSAVFVGQSMGGFITQAVIKRFPTIVKAFIAIDSTPYGKHYYSKSDIFWLKQIEWMSYLYPVRLLKKAIAKQVSETSNTYDNMLSMLSEYNKKELCHLMGIGYAGFLSDNCDLDIRCPVLLLIGEKDRTGKVKSYNKMWAKQTGYDLIIIENARHNSNVDNPTMVNNEIEKFMKKIES